MNYVIRAARPSDLQSIYEMAKLTGGGFTNLPPDKKALRSKLERAEASFASDKEYPSDELYLLVLEDTDSGEVRGTCQVFGQVGQRWPFYSYRIGTDSKHSEQLGRTFQACDPDAQSDGRLEIGGSVGDYAASALPGSMDGMRGGTLLVRGSAGRALRRPHAARQREHVREAGGSPFWDGVAGKFFGMSFQEADQFNAVNGNQFIADLMPKHPVYIAMLSDHARSVIGVPHPSGRAAMRMLEEEGFAFENYVDIFDGGPTMTARTDQVASIAGAKHGEVSAIAETGDDALVATGRLADFRCCFGKIGNGATLDAEAAKLLGVGKGGEISWIGR